MCGVFGSFRNVIAADDEKLKTAFKSLELRGPDARGEYRNGATYIAHFRLRIQDPVPDSDQPFWIDRYGISFNGQIYNHKVLREELIQSHGVQFRTHSDTEVILQSFIVWGVEAFSRFEGDFAGFIFDKANLQVTAFRDAFGVKPLYVVDTPEHLALSSLIEPLKIFLPEIRVNPKALAEHVAFRYSFGTHTLFEGVHRLKPGTVVVYDVSGKQAPRIHEIKNPHQNGDLLKALLKSVTGRIPEEQKMGLFLSGGIDSLGIASLLGNKTAWMAFTVNTGGSLEDVSFAKKWTQENHVEHKLLSPPQGDLKSRLMSLVARLEEPVGDSIGLLQDHLYTHARKHGKVAFSGEGADEMFYGYGHHYALWLWQKASPWLRLLGRWVPDGLLQRMNRYPEKIDGETLSELKELFTSGKFSDMAFYLTSTLRENEVGDLLGKEAVSHVKNLFSSVNSLERLWDFEQENWLPNYNLIRVDKLSMGHGLEVRVPYLSGAVRAGVLGRVNQEFRWGTQKVLLRRSLRSKLKSEYLKRKKHPFTLFSEHPLTREILVLAETVLNEPRSQKRPYWRPGGLKSVLDQPRSIVHAKKMVNLLMVELWMRINVDGDAVLETHENQKTAGQSGEESRHTAF